MKAINEHAKEIFTKLVTSNTFMEDLDTYSEIEDEKLAKESVVESITGGVSYAFFCAEIFNSIIEKGNNND